MTYREGLKIRHCFSICIYTATFRIVYNLWVNTIIEKLFLHPPSYPLYQRGNPQLRVFLPNFFMKMVRPSDPQPSNVVSFHVSMQMTHHDVKQYLEKIYKVPVKHVRLEVETGELSATHCRSNILSFMNK